MIYVGDQVFMDYTAWDGKEKFQTFLNQPKLKKLSFRDLVYQSLQKTLKTYGFKEEHFTLLQRSFYQEKQDDTQEDTDSMFTSEVAIGCVMMGIEIIFCFMPSGEATFYDPTSFVSLRNPSIESFIFVSLHSLVNENLIRLKKEPIEIKYGLLDVLQK